MATNTTNRNYPVPESTDAPRIYADIQDLGDAIDTDVQALLDVNTDTTIGSPASGFTVSTQDARITHNGALVTVALALICTAGLTATSGNITDTLCFTLASDYWPDMEMNAVFGSGAATGEVVINVDGTCVLRSLSDNLGATNQVRFSSTYVRSA